MPFSAATKGNPCGGPDRSLGFGKSFHVFVPTVQEFFMASRTLFNGTVVMVIAIFTNTTLRATENVTNAIDELAVSRVVVKILLFAEGKLLTETLVAAFNNPHLSAAKRTLSHDPVSVSPHHSKPALIWCPACRRARWRVAQFRASRVPSRNII